MSISFLERKVVVFECMTDFAFHELVFCFSNSNYRHETLSITLNEAMEIKGQPFVST